MKERDASEVAKILANLFQKRFYGKENVKYKIKKSEIADLSGKAKLTKNFRIEIEEELKKRGYLWVNLVKKVLIIEESFDNIRAVPKKMMKELTRRKKKVDKDISEKKKKKRSK